MKRFLENFFTVTTGRWAVSLQSVAMYLPFSFLYSLERESTLNISPFNTQLVVVTSGQLASILYLFIAQATLLSSRKERKQSFMLCLFVWSSSGIVAGFVSDLYSHNILGGDSHLFVRIANSTFISGLGLGIVAYCFGTIHKLRVEKSVYQSLEQILMKDSLNINESQNRATEIVTSNLNESLLPKVLKLQKLTSDLQKSGTSESLAVALHALELQAKDLQVKLNSTLTSIVQSQSQFSTKPAEILPTRKLMTGPFPRDLSVGTSFLILALGATLAQSTRNGLLGSLVGILSSVIIVTVLYILRTIGMRLNALGTGWFNAVSYFLVFGFQYLTTTVVQHSLTSLPYPYEAWYSALKTFFGVYLASLISTLVTEQNNSINIMKATNTEQLSQIESLNISHDQIQHLSSSTLVGAIQGQISGVIMALNVLTNTDGMQNSKRDLSKFIASTSELLGDAIWEIQQAGKKAHSR